MNEMAAWLMVFVRGGALLAIFPVLSSHQFPVRLRVALAAMLAFLMSPSVAAAGLGAWQFWDCVGTLVQEAGVGLVMGFVARMTFYAMEFCAGVVGMEVGLNAASSFNPLSESRTEVFGTLIFLLGAVLLFTLDLHHWMLAAFQRSYALAPMGRAGLSMPLFHEVVARSSAVFESGFIMSAPVLAISFLISVTFALVSRAVPTMNVFAESFSFRILAGMLVFGFTLNLTAQHIANYLRRLPEDMMRVTQFLASR